MEMMEKLITFEKAGTYLRLFTHLREELALKVIGFCSVFLHHQCIRVAYLCKFTKKYVSVNTRKSFFF